MKTTEALATLIFISMFFSTSSFARPTLICSGANACANPGAISQACALVNYPGVLNQKIEVRLMKDQISVDEVVGNTFVIPRSFVKHGKTGEVTQVPEHAGFNFETELYTCALEFFSSPLRMEGVIKNKITGRTQYSTTGARYCP